MVTTIAMYPQCLLNKKILVSALDRYRLVGGEKDKIAQPVSMFYIIFRSKEIISFFAPENDVEH